MNDMIELIKSRRSIRKFKPDMVEKEKIEQIVEAGLYAPTGKGLQSTKILVIADKELRDRFSVVNCQIGGWNGKFDPFYGAPVILVVLTDATNPNGRYDGSLVMENLMLAAEALGLGSIWINRAREEFAMDEFKGLLAQLGIEGEWEGIGHVALGYADERPKAAPRKPDRVFWLE